MTRSRLGAALLLALALVAASSAAPESAYAVLGIDLPGPQDVVESMFSWALKTFFGIKVDVGRRAVEFLVAHPAYANAGDYPELNRLRVYNTGGAWGIWALVVLVAALRYWTSGFTASGSYEALQGFVRGAVAAGALIVYPQVFGWATVSTNLLTHAVLTAPGVEAGVTKLLAGALVSNFSPLGLGAIAQVVAVIVLVLLVVTKIVLATLLGLLFVSGGLAIALWPLPETSWIARTWMQTMVAVLLWPVIWSLCFAFFAVMGSATFSLKGSFGKNLIEPWVTVASLWVAHHAPRVFARSALAAGLSPNVGSGVARTVVYGRQATRAGRTAAGGAAGVSGHLSGGSGAAGAAARAGRG